MTTKKDQHVVPHSQGWAVKSAGASKASLIFKTQEQAIMRAITIAKNQKSEVVIHRKDGTIRDKDSYGKDPKPPMDKKF